jgi:hypothetical protein
VVVDLDADDFRGYCAALAKRWGRVSIDDEIDRIRVLFR